MFMEFFSFTAREAQAIQNHHHPNQNYRVVFFLMAPANISQKHQLRARYSGDCSQILDHCSPSRRASIEPLFLGTYIQHVRQVLVMTLDHTSSEIAALWWLVIIVNSVKQRTTDRDKPTTTQCLASKYVVITIICCLSHQCLCSVTLNKKWGRQTLSFLLMDNIQLTANQLNLLNGIVSIAQYSILQYNLVQSSIVSL